MSRRQKKLPKVGSARDAWLAGLAAAGLVLSVYLLATRVAHAPTYCPLGSGCDIVQSSRYAAVFGIPVAALGVGYYALLFALGVRTLGQPGGGGLPCRWHWRASERRASSPSCSGIRSGRRAVCVCCRRCSRSRLRYA